MSLSMCDAVVGVTTSLSPGAGSYSARQMSNATSNLAYNLFTSSQRIAVWGDGSGGSDLYVYRSVAESTAAERDMIVLDNGDKIDLSFIDAQPGSPGHQPFNYIGDRAVTNNAGELRAIQSGSLWVVEADIDGNGVADLVIDVLASTPMTVDSFVGAAVFM